MKEAKGLYGQVFVMESQTGHIKAWVALEDEFRNGRYSDAPLLKHQLCADPLKPLFATHALIESNTSWNDSVDTKCGIDSIGGMMIKDHNWHRGGYGMLTYLDGFKMHSNIAYIRAMEKIRPVSLRHDWWEVADNPRDMDAMTVATIYNAIALEGNNVVIPSVNTDSIKTRSTEGYPEEDFRTARMFKEYLKATLQDGGIGSRWTTKKVDISGDYLSHRNCRPTIYDDNAQDMDKYYSEEGLMTYNQIIFVGYFPSDKPRYTICVTMDKEGLPLFGGTIAKTVNKLAEYLNKH